MVDKIKTKGKKGGLSMFTPETIGAMTGAAIGGLAGLFLGGKSAREKLATAKDKAIDTAGNVLEDVENRLDLSDEKNLEKEKSSEED